MEHTVGTVRAVPFHPDSLVTLERAGLRELADALRAGAWVHVEVADPVERAELEEAVQRAAQKVAVRVERALSRSDVPLTAGQIKQRTFGGSGGQRELVDGVLTAMHLEGTIVRDGKGWRLAERRSGGGAAGL